MPKITMTNHGKRKGGYTQRHNDRNFTSEHCEHIDFSKSKENVYWTWTGSKNITFEQAEYYYYKRYYKAMLKMQNGKYAKNRQYNYIRTYTDKLLDAQQTPKEYIFQLGDREDGIDKETTLKVFQTYIDTLQEIYGTNFHVLDWSLHADEPNAGIHIHYRAVFDYIDKDGITKIGQDKALKQMGISLKDPSQKKHRYNNRCQVFTEIQRNLAIDICNSFGLDVVPSLNPGGLDKDKFEIYKDGQKKQEQERQERFAKEDQEHAEKLAKISKEIELKQAKSEEIAQANENAELLHLAKRAQIEKDKQELAEISAKKEDEKAVVEYLKGQKKQLEKDVKDLDKKSKDLNKEVATKTNLVPADVDFITSCINMEQDGHER